MLNLPPTIGNQVVPGMLQTNRVQAGDTGQIAAPHIVHEVLAAPGQPLDPATRDFMEPASATTLAMCGCIPTQGQWNPRDW
jgi:hypothetical protein